MREQPDYGQRWAITTAVCPKKRRVCLTAVGTFNLAPQDVWRLLTLPEADPIFRVQQRQRLAHDPAACISEEEVVFLAPIRVLLWKTWAKTRVRQAVTASDQQQLHATFRLVSSSMMSHLTGGWQLQQLAPTGPPLTRVTYSFEMWPKGVPTALHCLPGLVEAVKAAVAREAAQLFDKISFVAGKVGPGVPLPAALREAAGEVAQSGGSFKQLQLSLSVRSSSCDSCGTEESFTAGAAAHAAAAAAPAPLLQRA